MANKKDNSFGFVVAGLLLGIFMSAMDNTIVATAMGTIVSDLGGLDKFVWVTSAYLVTSMAGMPIFGKLSDMYGRKRFYIFGLLLFLLGSILCGTAHNIIQLSIYRAIQGIGAGALMPIAFTIVFDIFPPEKRGKMTGLFGAVFGTSSIFGPLLGAYITEFISWRWVFYINLPIGILSFIFIAAFYRETIAHFKQKIDWWGAITLVVAVVCLMFALELGGNKYEWNSAPILALFGAFALMFIAFFYAESKAEEPIISFGMFRDRLYAASNAVGLFYSASFIVATVYIPIFIQGVLGGSATNSGLLLMPMMVGSVIASQLGGFLSTKTSYRNVMLGSGLFLVLGIFLLSRLTAGMSQSLVTLYMIITGFGVGFSFSTLSMSAIHNFNTRQRGSATSTLSFLRSLGMTLGITVFGIIQRNIFTSHLSAAFDNTGQSGAGGPYSDPRSFLSPEARIDIPAPILEKITYALSASIAHTFLWTMVPAVLGFLCVFFMTDERLVIPGRVRQKE